MRRLTISGVSVIAMGLIAIAGCEHAPPRMAVSGSVTFKGTPLKDGLITFIPLTAPLQEGVPIVDGKFTIPRDKGLAPGIYRVSISSIESRDRPDPKKPPTPSGGAASKEVIPPEFNEKSKEEIEVTAAGPNRFDFKIP